MRDEQYAVRMEENNRQRFWKDISLVALEQACKGLAPIAAADVSAEVADNLLKEFDKRFGNGSNTRR